MARFPTLIGLTITLLLTCPALAAEKNQQPASRRGPALLQQVTAKLRAWLPARARGRVQAFAPVVEGGPMLDPSSPSDAYWFQAAPRKRFSLRRIFSRQGTPPAVSRLPAVRTAVSPAAQKSRQARPIVDTVVVGGDQLDLSGPDAYWK